MPMDPEVVDVVCGMRFDPRLATETVEFEGRRYYFCCPVCREEFLRDPARYTRRPPPRWAGEEGEAGG